MTDRGRRRLAPAILGLLLLLAAVALAGRPQIGEAGVELTPSSRRGYLPMIRVDPSPTPRPTETPYSAASTLAITPGMPLNASTFTPGSFVVENRSRAGQRLVELRIDLRTAIFPDMVFDPDGEAGDTVAKDVTIDEQVGLSVRSRSYDGPHAGGYDGLVLRFDNFDPGDRLKFSVDVDPTSIAGSAAPGPAESGSVGGLELIGATVTMRFDDGTLLTNAVYRMPAAGATSGALVTLRDGAPPRPAIVISGVDTPAVVTDPEQTVRVAGPAGLPVTVLVVEGGLFTEGLPNGGFDLDPFEANSAVSVREYAATVGPSGSVELPIVLSRTSGQAGINHITAAFDNGYGLRGAVAAPLVLQLR